MQKGDRFRFVAVIGLVVALMSAGFALAGDAFDTPDEPEPTVCEPVDDVVDEDGDTVDDGDVVEGDEGEGQDGGVVDEDGDTVDEGDTVEDGDEPVDEGNTDDCDDEAVEDDDAEAAEEGDDVEAAVEPSQEHIDACLAAAHETAAPAEGPIPGEKQGLENAIAHVLWNCIHHENLGLPRALGNLYDNLQAKLEREELKAERKAEREAAKAEREAARAERKAAQEAAKAARELSRSS